MTRLFGRLLVLLILCMFCSTARAASDVWPPQSVSDGLNYLYKRVNSLTSNSVTYVAASGGILSSSFTGGVATVTLTTNALTNAMSQAGFATTNWVQAQGYITNYVETDPIWSAVSNQYATTNWVQAQGYITNYIETDTLGMVVGRGNRAGRDIDMGEASTNSITHLKALTYSTEDGEGYMTDRCTIDLLTGLIDRDQMWHPAISYTTALLNFRTRELFTEFNTGGSFVSMNWGSGSLYKIPLPFSFPNDFVRWTYTGIATGLNTNELMTWCATTNYVTSRGYVTASITNGLASTNWVSSQGYLTNELDPVWMVTYTNKSINIGLDSISSLGNVAIGWFASATNGAGSTAIGFQSKASGFGSSLGYAADSTNYGAAVGYSALAPNYGAAIGHDAKAIGIGNVAIGWGAIANTFGGTNTYTTEIGWGTATHSGWLHYRGKAIVDGNGNYYGPTGTFSVVNVDSSATTGTQVVNYQTMISNLTASSWTPYPLVSAPTVTVSKVMGNTLALKATNNVLSFTFDSSWDTNDIGRVSVDVYKGTNAFGFDTNKITGSGSITMSSNTTDALFFRKNYLLNTWEVRQ